MSTSVGDWSEAEALAREYLKTNEKVSAEISFHRHIVMPFLLGAWWTGSDGKEAKTSVLVYDGKVHPERGVKALPAYFENLGEARLRALSVNNVDTMLVAMGPYRPAAADVGAPWRFHPAYPDLHPTLVDADGVWKYVVHYSPGTPSSRPVAGEPPPPRTGAPAPPAGGPPPPPGAAARGSKPPGPFVLQRWSLQLYPVQPDLDWKLEGLVERPEPPVYRP